MLTFPVSSDPKNLDDDENQQKYCAPYSWVDLVPAQPKLDGYTRGRDFEWQCYHPANRIFPPHREAPSHRMLAQI